MNKMKNISKKKCVKCFVVMLSIVLTGCGMKSGKDNPLANKDTDERIIMCLQKTYPEHQFETIETYEIKRNQGIYVDENGVKFKVTNITYNNRYHFGCRDEYLFTLLNQQNYVEEIKKILENYNLQITKEELGISVLVELNSNTDVPVIAQAVYEVLNSVDVPEVVFPKQQGFSTGEVNYYSVPKWGIFRCDFEDKSIEVTDGEQFYFEDKSLSVTEIEKRLNDITREIRYSN